tara:strand:+ start:228 stop:662 length:435 start_codon:yes stop_codon:yes gene_type:complete
MKIEKKIIKELSDYLDEFNLTEIEYTDKDLKVKVSKSQNYKGKENQIVRSNVVENNKNISTDTTVLSGNKVSSPIIGTAYLAPEPGGKKFAEVGKKIKKGDTLLIVEAMKTMNHIPSPYDGTVKEICVEDGQPVEFGQTIAILD